LTASRLSTTESLKDPITACLRDLT